MINPNLFLEPVEGLRNKPGDFSVETLNNFLFPVYISEMDDLDDPASEKVVWANHKMHEYAGKLLGDPGTTGCVPAGVLRHPDELMITRDAGKRLLYEDFSVQPCSFMRLKNSNGLYKWFFMQTYVLEYDRERNTGCFLTAGIDAELQQESEGSLNNLLRLLRRRKHSERIAVISEREHQILQLVIEGLTDKEIADRLYISPRTAQTHRNRLLKKTGTLNTASLVAFAYECGLR
jgi:DNA-binding CsgD family transcriptional regulator